VSRLQIFFLGRMRRRVIFDFRDVGTIARQNPLANGAGSERGAAWTGHMAIFVDGAEATDGIELFTGDIGVIDLPFEFDLLIAAAATAPANLIPKADARQCRYLQFFRYSNERPSTGQGKQFPK
jgi:hypothetical protein